MYLRYPGNHGFAVQLISRYTAGLVEIDAIEAGSAHARVMVWLEGSAEERWFFRDFYAAFLQVERSLPLGLVPGIAAFRTRGVSCCARRPGDCW